MAQPFEVARMVLQVVDAGSVVKAEQKRVLASAGGSRSGAGYDEVCVPTS